MTCDMSIYRFLLSAVMAAAIFTLRGEVKWLAHSYDFGMMKEAAGPQTGIVKFVNTGADEVTVTEVRTSCGCTSARYPEDPVAPGDTAVIAFTYDPTGRPGPFEKTIRVKYTGEGGLKIINIKGNVLGTPQSLSRIYPDEAGPVRMTTSVVYGGEIKKGKSRNDFFTIYNQSTDTIVPAVKSTHPALQFESTELKLGPGDTATFSVFYDSTKDDTFGPVSIPFEIISDTKSAGSPVGSMTYNCNVVPDFSNLTQQQMAEAPVIKINPEPVNAGEISPETGKKKLTVTITNEGKSPLDIYRVYTFYKEVNIIKSPKTIKPGKSGEVEIELNAEEIPQGLFQTEFRIMANDPRLSVTPVKIFGTRL